MPGYRINLGSGNSYAVDAPNQVEAIREAQRLAAEERTYVASVESTNEQGEVTATPFVADEQSFRPTIGGIRSQVAQQTEPITASPLWFESGNVSTPIGGKWTRLPTSVRPPMFTPGGKPRPIAIDEQLGKTFQEGRTPTIFDVLDPTGGYQGGPVDYGIATPGGESRSMRVEPDLGPGGLDDPFLDQVAPAEVIISEDDGTGDMGRGAYGFKDYPQTEGNVVNVKPSSNIGTSVSYTHLTLPTNREV